MFESPVFVSSLGLFTTSLEEINSAELNEVLVRYLTHLIDQLTLKFSRKHAAVQQLFMQHYQLILRALMVTVSKPNMQHELGYIATSLQNAINWSEQGGFEP